LQTSQTFRNRLKKLDLDGLKRLLGSRQQRQEVYRVRFNRSRSVSHGEAYRLVGFEIGEIKAAIRQQEKDSNS
jgi:hypothetical protein